jgi:hypothetical protein
MARGAITAAAVPAALLAITMAQATGPSGVQPKNWLTPGVFTTSTSAAIDAAQVTTTIGLRAPVSS